MRSYSILSLLLLLFFSQPAWSQDVIGEYVPDAAIVGQGRLVYVIWDVYDATLLAPNGKWEEGKPMALTLNYLREISGKDIARASEEAIRHQKFTDEKKIASWRKKMEEIFPDVKNGTSLTGIVNKKGETIFILNDKKEIGRVKDPLFSKYFFNIWLGKDSTRKALRKQLLGL